MKTRIALKLLALVLAVTTIGMALAGWIGMRRASAMLFEQESRALEAVRAARGRMVERGLRKSIEQVAIMARSPTVELALQGFTEAFQKLPEETAVVAVDDPELTAYYGSKFRPRLEANGTEWPGLTGMIPSSKSGRILQHDYLAANPHPVGEKHLLQRSPGDTSYDRVHDLRHPFFRDYLRSAGYYDLFLFDRAGNLIYTVSKETDFATNFKAGPYRESGLGRAFQEALSAADGAAPVVMDFSAYRPSYDSPAAFVAAPIFAGDKRIGVLAAQLSIDDINAVMREQSGMGETGESYLVGPDKLLRTDSRFFDESTLLKRTVDTESVAAALAGRSGTWAVADYRGVPVLSSYEKLDVPGLDWVILAEKDIAEVNGPIAALRNQLFLVTFIGLVLTALVLNFVLRHIVIQPIHRLNAAADAIDGGDYSARARIESKDEFFELAETLNRMATSIQTDIAEREEANVRLRDANEAAKAATQAKSAFLATMSHEIRTPMNAIINMTQLALDTDLTSKQLQYLKVVSSSSRGLLALINDILDFSKVEAGKMELEQAPFSIRRLFEEVTDSFRGRVLEKKLEFIVHVEPDVPDSIVGDTLRLRQVLINLVGNAFKFTENGEVVVRVQLADQPAPAGCVPLHFSVRDSGIGIPKSKQASLFQSFSQVDTSHSRKYGGTGLGLAISLKLVDLMGGQLQVESEPGQGTTFWFEAEFAGGDLGPPPKIPTSIRNVHTLVVDDNESSRELMKTLLEQFGMSCEVAGGGLEALQAVNEANVDRSAGRPFDLVLLDWLMPGMDGLEALRELRRQPATADLPVVMISAFATRAEEERASLLGCRTFLHKPITGSHLFDAVAQIFDQSYTAQTRMISASQADDEAANHRLLRGVHMLMAEDNDANQMVAQELLESVGIVLDIADNGRIAVDKLAEKDDYALVLMDMQMPEMDGITATKEIRKRWPDRKLPIVALTANAMKGDMERCLEAGMDDYVSKPIDREQLFAALRKWVPEDAHRTDPSDQSDPTDQSPDEIPELPGIDITDAMKRLGLPLASIKTMLLRFADGQPAILQDLREALDAKDREAARRHAHSIAGAGGNLSAIDLRKSAKALELAIKDEQGDYEKLYTEMNEELTRVLDGINTMRPAEEKIEAAAADQPVDKAALSSALEKLKTALEEGDMDGIEAELVACGKLGTPAELCPDMAKVRSLADQYDYFAAATVAERMIENLA